MALDSDVCLILHPPSVGLELDPGRGSKRENRTGDEKARPNHFRSFDWDLFRFEINLN